MAYTYRDARPTGNAETVSFGVAQPALVTAGWVLVADDLDAAAAAAVVRYNRDVAEQGVVAAAALARTAAEAASSGAGAAGGSATLDSGGDVPLTQLDNIDADTRAIGLLTPSNDDFLQRKAGAWTNRTVAQVRTDLAALPLAGGTLTGELVASASTTVRASVNIPHGVAPTAPADGDVWTTTAGLFVRANGVTVGPLTGAA